jgi:Pex2 / Pex12 amino terminal region
MRSIWQATCSIMDLPWREDGRHLAKNTLTYGSIRFEALQVSLLLQSVFKLPLLSMIRSLILLSQIRTLLVIISLLPAYMIPRLRSSNVTLSPMVSAILSKAPQSLVSLSSINLAIFYIRGRYHTIAQRLLRTSYISTVPPNPNVRQPSYALLGVLVLARLTHNLYLTMKDTRNKLSEKARGKLPEYGEHTRALEPMLEDSMYLDYTPVTEIMAHQADEDLDSGEPFLLSEGSNPLYTLRSSRPRQAYFARYPVSRNGSSLLA